MGARRVDVAAAQLHRGGPGRRPRSTRPAGWSARPGGRSRRSRATTRDADAGRCCRGCPSPTRAAAGAAVGGRLRHRRDDAGGQHGCRCCAWDGEEWGGARAAARAALQPRRGRARRPGLRARRLRRGRGAPRASSSTTRAPTAGARRRRCRARTTRSAPSPFRGEIWVIGGRRGRGGPPRGLDLRPGDASAGARGPALPKPMELLGAAVVGDEIHAVWESTYQIYDAAHRALAQGPPPRRDAARAAARSASAAGSTRSAAARRRSGTRPSSSSGRVS